MSIKATVSFHQDTEHNIEHDNRKAKVSYADPKREKDNIYYEGNMTLADAYKKLFEQSIIDYNNSQKRNDRKRPSVIDEKTGKESFALAYLDNLIDKRDKENTLISQMKRNGETFKTINRMKKAVKPAYQFIVTIGNRKDNPEFMANGGEKKDIPEDILKKYLADFEKRNPNVFVYNAAIHEDEEGVIHLHMSVVFVGKNMPKGPKVQASVNQALREMGFESDKEKNPETGAYELAITKWQNHEREYISELCHDRDIEVVKGDGNTKHLSRQAYIAEQKQKEAEKAMESLANEELAFDMMKQNTESQIEEKERELSQKYKAAQQQIKKEQEESINLVKNFASATAVDYTAVKTYKENEKLRKKVREAEKNEEKSKDILAYLWEEYKSANRDYWADYKEKKTELLDLIKVGKQDKRYNDKRIKELTDYICSSNGFILFKLAALIGAICLKIHDSFLQRNLDNLIQKHRELKESCKDVLADSKEMSMALKSKDYDRIAYAVTRWNDNFISLYSDVKYVIEGPDTVFEKDIEEERERIQREKDNEER